MVKSSTRAVACRVVLITAAMLASSIPAGSLADSIVSAGALPTATYGTTSVWTGSQAYIFGGRQSIYRYDPSTLTTITMSAQFSGWRQFASSIWTGTHAYIFGGKYSLYEILRYDPAADRVETSGASLPLGLWGSSAVWDGESAFIFGGYNGLVYLNSIIKFTPTTGETEVLPVTLPTGRAYTSAVWDGSAAWIVGGYYTSPTGDSIHSDQILRFDPAAEKLTASASRLPSGREGTSAIWDGENVMIFGGIADDCYHTYDWYYGCPSNYYGQVLKFQTRDSLLVTMSSTLPSSRGFTSAIYNGTEAFVFGGYFWGESTGEIQHSQIVKFNGSPGSPLLLGNSGPAEGQVTLTWNKPSLASFSTWPFKYIVYKGTAPGEETPYTEVPYGLTVNTFVDDCGAGVICFYRVAAVNSVGIGTLSNGVPHLPYAPQSPRAQTGPAKGQITVSWQVPAYDGGRPITSYRVYAGPGSPSSLVAEVSESARSYTLSGLADGEARYVRIGAVSSQGEGLLSAQVSASAPTVPSAPRNLSLTFGPGLGDNTLTWSLPASNGGLPVTSYRIYRGSTSANVARFDEVSAGVLSYTDSTCTLGSLCYYRVTAVNVVGESLLSNTVTAVGWKI